MQPKTKPAVVKDEPLSPTVKSEPETSPQKGAKGKETRAKKGDGEKKVVEKKVVVKKEYDLPGQTRETPSEVSSHLILTICHRLAPHNTTGITGSLLRPASGVRCMTRHICCLDYKIKQLKHEGVSDNVVFDSIHC